MPSIYLVLDRENDLIHEDGPNGPLRTGCVSVTRRPPCDSTIRFRLRRIRNC